MGHGLKFQVHSNGLLTGIMYLVISGNGYGCSQECRRRETFFVSKNMLKFYLLLSIFPILAVLFAILGIFLKIKNAKFPYIKKDCLMSEAEKKFYFVLLEIIGNDYLIFSKVRLADLLYLPKMSNSDFYHYQNKIQSKHVDFLICDKENVNPLLVVELDDSSHLKMDRILRDKLVDKIFESAKLPILHIKFSNNYDSNSLLDQINKAVCL